MVQHSLKLALAQVNPTVGAARDNGRMISARIAEAREAGADLVVFGELCVSGYPAEDLYLKRHFLVACREELDRIAADVRGIAALVGFPELDESVDPGHMPDAPRPRIARNSLALLRDGGVQAIYRKQRLPNYAVFDERRYFEPGTEPVVIDVAGVPVGLTICEDCWEPGPPASDEAQAGAQLIVNASASPYLRGKRADRERMFQARAESYGTAIAFCNIVGGQDELVFDGSSAVVGSDGAILARAGQFTEELLLCDLESGGPVAEPLDDLEETYRALVVGLRDYVAKNGFERVLVAVSGGIDSALVAQVAADAVGGASMTGVVMPSPHSSAETQADARAIVRNLGAELLEVPIEGAMGLYDDMLSSATGEALEGVAAENLQARIRGNLMMALSNSRGALVLTTGNKSEMSVGYATLYGDMAGGFAVIKDVPKTLVYSLVEHRNAKDPTPLVPPSVISRPPSAELRPDQLDSDSLPDYNVLDRILAAYVEHDRSRDEIVATGEDPEVVERVIRLVDLAEYKRRQAPPGVRITARAFGRDRRLPITNRFGG